MIAKVLNKFKSIDFTILIVMTMLIIIGLFCAQQAFLHSEVHEPIFIKQIAGILIGFFLILAIIIMDYHLICALSLLLYAFMIAVLALTLVIGTNINNVKRWISFFGIQFQPSELTKVVLILFLAFLCNYFRNKLNKLHVLFLFIMVVAIPCLLILLEPHMSSCLSILFIFGIIMYTSGISYKLIGIALSLGLLLLTGLYISIAFLQIDIPFIKDYQINRVLFFVSTDESEHLTGDYQQLQAVSAIGSGGLYGKMLSPEAEKDRLYSSIYAKESDFVFTIIGEEFGFIGSFCIILLYAILNIRCFIISIKASDYMGRIICMGVSAYFMFQFFVNIGVATKLLPNTGLPLPFISNGISSLISSMAAVGLVLSVGVNQKIKKKEERGHVH